jgi:GNAT superfamily N-acetyltransferase
MSQGQSWPSDLIYVRLDRPLCLFRIPPPPGPGSYNICSDCELVLNIIFTHPDYRRRGVAELLLEWGIKRADELGLEIWLDSTVYGVPLYKKHGFQVVKENNINPQTENPDDDWRKIEEDLLPITLWSMWRPIRGEYEDGKTPAPQE